MPKMMLLLLFTLLAVREYPKVGALCRYLGCNALLMKHLFTGVRILHKAILNRLYWQFKEFPYSATEKVAVFKTALTFVDSVAEIWGPLISGIAILVVPKLVTKNPEAFIDLLERYKVNMNGYCNK